MIKIQLEGIDEAMGEVGTAIKNYALTQMYSDMVLHAPKDTGYMADHIEIDYEAGEINSTAPYTGFVEFGHGFLNFSPGSELTSWPAKTKRGGNSPQTIPFIRPAIYRFISHAESMPARGWQEVYNRYKRRGDLKNES
jgi:hypothetical protein